MGWARRGASRYAARMSRALIRSLAPLVLASVLVGCSARGPASVEVPAGSYPSAFESAKAALREMRLPIERVDFAAGVITTIPELSSGLATPWDPVQSSFGQEWEDMINGQRRAVRITFASPEAAEPAPAVQASPVSTPSTLLDRNAGPLVARVDVAILRPRRPGARPQPAAARFESRTEDPELTRRGMYPEYTTTIARDDRLAARIADLIRDGMGRDARASAEQ